MRGKTRAQYDGDDGGSPHCGREMKDMDSGDVLKGGAPISRGSLLADREPSDNDVGSDT